MSFQSKHAELVYILASIKLHIAYYMDSGHYIYDIIDYNTGPCWNVYDGTITTYSGYPDNVYDNSSKRNEPKDGGNYYEWIK